MLEPDEVHVWWVATADLRPDGGDVSWMLSADEQARRKRLAGEHDRRAYAAARALLRTTLSMYGNLTPDAWSFEENAHGKPRLRSNSGEPTLEFNLSHAPSLVACAVARDMEVGVDVECIDRVARSPALYDRCLSEGERARLNRGPATTAPVRFAELWTLKEALLKAVGVGLSFEPSLLTFDLAGDKTIQFRPPQPLTTRSFYCALFEPTPDHRLALVVGSDRNTTVRVCARSAADGREVQAVRSTPLRTAASRTS
jgi:4'-phosphopantetheinyl transferase